MENTIFSVHLFGNVDRGANHDFTIFPCDGRSYRMILQQQLVFNLFICFYFSCKSSLTEKVENTIFSLHIFGNVDRGANHDFTIFPCDGRSYRMILQQQLVFNLFICFYFSCKSSLTERWKIQYFPCISLESLTEVQTMILLFSPMTDEHIDEFQTPANFGNRILLSAEINLLQKTFVVDKRKYFTYMSSQDSKLDHMSYPVASAVTKRYVSKFHRGKSSQNEVLLPTKSIFCES